MCNIKRTVMENTQIVVRTYSSGYKNSNIDSLQEYLNKGYTVLIVTPLRSSENSSWKGSPNPEYQINEYILNPPKKD